MLTGKIPCRFPQPPARSRPTIRDLRGRSGFRDRPGPLFATSHVRMGSCEQQGHHATPGKAAGVRACDRTAPYAPFARWPHRSRGAGSAREAGPAGRAAIDLACRAIARGVRKKLPGTWRSRAGLPCPDQCRPSARGSERQPLDGVGKRQGGMRGHLGTPSRVDVPHTVQSHVPGRDPPGGDGEGRRVRRAFVSHVRAARRGPGRARFPVYAY